MFIQRSSTSRVRVPLTIKILVVDTHGVVQEMIKEMLTPLECQVITASSTALAIFLARKNFPSLIVLNTAGPQDDMDLPREISHDSDLCQIPVLVFVPPEHPEMLHSVETSEMTRVLRRPQTAHTLRDILIPYLRETADEREAETTE